MPTFMRCQFIIYSLFKYIHNLTSGYPLFQLVIKIQPLGRSRGYSFRKCMQKSQKKKKKQKQKTKKQTKNKQQTKKQQKQQQQTNKHSFQIPTTMRQIYFIFDTWYLYAIRLKMVMGTPWRGPKN